MLVLVRGNLKVDLKTEPESLETNKRGGDGEALVAVVRMRMVVVLTRSILVPFLIMFLFISFQLRVSSTQKVNGQILFFIFYFSKTKILYFLSVKPRRFPLEKNFGYAV